MACIFAGSLRKLVVKMKKLVLILTVAFGLSATLSCKKENLTEGVSYGDINFSVREISSVEATKSAQEQTIVLKAEDGDESAPYLIVTGIPTIAAQDPQVKSSAVSKASLSQFTTDAVIKGATKRYMDAVPVKYVEGKWKADPKPDGNAYTWHWNADKGGYDPIAFWAHTPKLTGAYSVSDASFSFDYVSPASDKTQDLVLAYTVQSNETVSFGFNHVLSAVGAFVDPEQDDNLTITSFAFSDIYTRGKCTCSASGSNALTPTWTALSTKGDYGMALTNGDTSFDSSDYFFVIPQEFSEGTDAKIVLNCTGKTFGDNKTLRYSLKNTTWKAGYTYVYRLGYPNVATLLNGYDFWHVIGSLVPESRIESVEFKVNSPISSYDASWPRAQVQDNAVSKVKIYAVYNDSARKLYVTTAADEMYSNESMMRMFLGSEAGREIPTKSIDPYPFSSLKSVVFGPLNTSKTKSMEELFAECGLLSSVDLNSLNTENVETFRDMFDGCNSLTNIDISSWKTPNLTNTWRMFFGCHELTSITLNKDKFSTDKVTDMAHMFDGCSKLYSVDLSGFNTANVKDMSYMFSGCSSLSSLALPGFNTESCTNMTYMFDSCSSLASLDLSAFKTASVTNMSYMFNKCTSLRSLTLSDGFNTAKVTDMQYMFYNCKSLSSLDVSGFNTENVRNMARMFFQCEALEVINVSGFNTAKVTNMSSMFNGCKKVKNLDVSRFSTSLVTNFSCMFYYCDLLENLNLDSFDTANALYMDYMFCDCGSLTSLNLNSFVTSKVKNMEFMFCRCRKLASLLLDFDTANVTRMNNMFDSCELLTTINTANFNTGKVTTMNRMFYACFKLASLDLTSFNTSSVTDMAWMFYECDALTTLKLNSFNTSKVTTMQEMFYSASCLNDITLGSSFVINSNCNKQNMMLLCGGYIADGTGKLQCSSATWTALSSGAGLSTDKWSYVSL